MRPTSTLLKAVRIAAIPKEVPLYAIPQLSTISYKDLPNNGFGEKNYSIVKTKFKQWPVYLKVQNTKITTEIKRVKGDINQLKHDLLKINPNFQISVNQRIGYINIRGDIVNQLKQKFDENL